MKNYQPKQGDIIIINLEPQAGHETAKRRPALVITGSASLKRLGGSAMICPITSTNNGFPLHVPLDEESKSVSGYVMCEQAKTLDLWARNAVYADRASKWVVNEVRDILKAMLD